MFSRPFAFTAFFYRLACFAGVALVFAALFLPSQALAHGVSEASRETLADGGIFEYVRLGAEHMVTGYDHLLFLFGVLFFLTGFRDVLRFITAFTVGHCITLLGATLAGVTANAYLVDAVIALSVIYKGFENLDGFDKVFRIRAPNLLFMVFLFGLIHGFGLSTRLQELPLGDEGLISRILAFNVGVELGQVAALTVMLGIFKIWRASKAFERLANIANGALVLAGLGLFFYQVSGYLREADHAGHPVEEAADHGDHAHPKAAGHDTEPDSEVVVSPDPAEPDPSPDDAAINEPAKTGGHGHGHGHGNGHGHGHSSEPVEKAVEEPEEAPVEKKESHSHGAGEHTH
jgi:hypothetical protein